ncbi:hypothetical protein V5E97_28780 [Singulisphaera sp. Ch08]|uniref:Uncharacterized protein n=1 Tax=Singulisphaera sp. Ch08 TaxID=3120278 RepID=A0AAU7CB07_9BACT
MILVVVAAVTLALIPIVHRAVYPDSHSTYSITVGDTCIFSVEF